VPAVAGLGGGAVVATAVHVLVGWQATAVVLAPLAMAAGAAGVLAMALLTDRVGGEALGALALEAAEAGGGVLAVPRLFPKLIAALERGVRRLLAGPGIAETESLLEAFGPVFGPLILLGFAPAFALVVAGWAAWRALRDGREGWLLVAVYATYFFGLALVQRRFAGEAAPFLAVLGELGFVALLSWFDLTRMPAVLTDGADDGPGVGSDPGSEEPTLELPGRRRLLLLAGFGISFGGTGALFSVLIGDRVATDPRLYRAARWMSAYADGRGWSYPDSYVFSVIQGGASGLKERTE
jgi:dolichyl-diphosphooligosaccharide--protein glycosyltransferase